MNGDRFIVDTNIILYYLKGDKEITELLSDNHPIISFISELELLSFKFPVPSDEELVRNFLKNIQITNINSSIKRHAIEIRKESNLKLPDSIIAATAMYHDLSLLTADKAFARLVNPSIVIYSP